MVQELKFEHNKFTGSSKINGAKFSDACCVRANWLYMGWPFCLAEMRREFQTGGNFFCTTLYFFRKPYIAQPKTSICNERRRRRSVTVDAAPSSSASVARKSTAATEGGRRGERAKHTRDKRGPFRSFIIKSGSDGGGTGLP